MNEITESPRESILASAADARTHSVEQGLVYRYMEDMYGQPMQEREVQKKLSSEAQFLKLENGRLHVTGASGEALCEVDLEIFSPENGKLAAGGTYEVELVDETLMGTVWAIFWVNPDSFFGYTLESVEIQYAGTGAELEQLYAN